MTDDKPPVEGWYPHPLLKGAERYWDGDSWTSVRNLKAGSSLEKVQKSTSLERTRETMPPYGPPLMVTAIGGSGIASAGLLTSASPLTIIGGSMVMGALGAWGVFKSRRKGRSYKLVSSMETWTPLEEALKSQEGLSDSLAKELSSLLKAERALLEKARSLNRLPMATVELEHLNKQVLQLVSPSYWGSLVLSPQQWDEPQAKKLEVRLALKSAREQVHQWQKQLNESQEFAAEVALKQINTPE